MLDIFTVSSCVGGNSREDVRAKMVQTVGIARFHLKLLTILPARSRYFAMNFLLLAGLPPDATVRLKMYSNGIDSYLPCKNVITIFILHRAESITAMTPYFLDVSPHSPSPGTCSRPGCSP